MIKVKYISSANFAQLEIAVNDWLALQKLTGQQIVSIEFHAFNPALVAGEPCTAQITYLKTN